MDEQTPDVVDQGRRITDSLRAYGRAYGELGRSFATSLGLHSTDAQAVVEVIAAEDRGVPISQSKLSQRIGLTTGATSSLLNRLEVRGHITPLRVHEDRRIVTLHAAADIHQQADDFFGPLGVELDMMMATYPREVLDQVEKFVADLCLTMDGYIAERSETPAGRRPSQVGQNGPGGGVSEKSTRSGGSAPEVPSGDSTYTLLQVGRCRAALRAGTHPLRHDRSPGATTPATTGNPYAERDG